MLGSFKQDEMARAIADALDHHVRRVVGRSARRCRGGPAAAILERLRQVPVVETRPRLDAGFEQRIDQPIVEVETAHVDRAAAFGHDARPRDREAVGVEMPRRRGAHVLTPPVVVIAGAVAGVAALDLPRRVGENVPDAAAAPVLVERAFDLVRGGGGAEQETIGEPHAAIASRQPVERRI